jgi:hypothetical protein
MNAICSAASAPATIYIFDHAALDIFMPLIHIDNEGKASSMALHGAAEGPQYGKHDGRAPRPMTHAENYISRDPRGQFFQNKRANMPTIININ